MYKERFIFHREVKEIRENSIDDEHFLDNLQAYFNDYIDEAFEKTGKADEYYNEGFEDGKDEMEDHIEEECQNSYDEGFKDGVRNFLKGFRKYTDEISSSVEKARKYLIKTGIYTEDGEISEEYK